MKQAVFCIYLLFAPLLLTAQQSIDSIFVQDTIPDIIVRGYHNPTDYLQTTSSVALVDSNVLSTGSRGTLLEPLNTIPGVRMEQRSPGSYRLSIRGSLLRSPYGIRNTKLYLDDFVLTGASGNTYLNLIDEALIEKMEVFKGPHSSEYGVNTGGTVLLHSLTENDLSLNLTGGSQGYLHSQLSYGKQIHQHQLTALGAWQQSDGYREHSRMDRQFLMVKDRWAVADHFVMKGFGFYSDLYYDTPGGLTLEQRRANRRQARQATNFAPGAVVQQAGIDNETIFGGLSTRWDLSPTLQHVFAIQSSNTNLENPFVTNYEERVENEIGVRTQLVKQFNHPIANYNLALGYEGAVRNTSIQNFDNDAGEKADPQRFDDINIRNQFLYINGKANWNDRYFLEAGASLNTLSYAFETSFPTMAEQSKQFDSELMPKMGTSVKLFPTMSVRTSISKGFSPPTTEEIRPSTQQIYDELEAENGWNIELGLRHENLFDALKGEATFFQFNLNEAITRQENNQGQEFFSNTGGTRQHGLEFQLATHPIKMKNKWLKEWHATAAATIYNFQFENFAGSEQFLNGNQLTGVPQNTSTLSAVFRFTNDLLARYNHFYTSDIPLNDENTVRAEAYHIGNIQVEAPIEINNRNKLQVTAQINNVYNNEYSLGYDINAFGERYYNPAIKRNYMFGLQWSVD